MLWLRKCTSPIYNVYFPLSRPYNTCCVWILCIWIYENISHIWKVTSASKERGQFIALQKFSSQGWSKVSSVHRACLSSRGPEFNLQNTFYISHGSKNKKKTNKKPRFFKNNALFWFLKCVQMHTHTHELKKIINRKVVLKQERQRIANELSG